VQINRLLFENTEIFYGIKGVGLLRKLGYLSAPWRFKTKNPLPPFVLAGNKPFTLKKLGFDAW